MEKNTEQAIRKEFEKRFDHIRWSIIWLNSYIFYHSRYMSEDSKEYKRYAPFFSYSSAYSFMTTVSAIVCSLYFEGNLSIKKFVSFCEKNRDVIFLKTKRHFQGEEKDRLDNTLQEITDLISQNEKVLNSIRSIRNKIFCHFDLENLDERRSEILSKLDWVALKTLVEKSSVLLKKIGIAYNGVHKDFMVQNYNDINNLFCVCSTYEKHKNVLLDLMKADNTSKF